MHFNLKSLQKSIGKLNNYNAGLNKAFDVKSVVIVINMMGFKTYSRPAIVFLGKTVYGIFLCLVVLSNSYKF